MDLGPEDRLHRWLQRRLRRGGVDLLGDDGAILPTTGPLAGTQDQQIEGVHFSAGLDPALIARRLLAVNLSDLAAMGAEPAFAFLALSCPADFPAKRFLASMVNASERYGVVLAGGDLARNDKVAATLTLLGRLAAGSRWVRRRNARAGDRIWLAGQVGLSALGYHLLGRGARADARRVELGAMEGFSGREIRLAKKAIRRHLSPRPQLETGYWLARQSRAAAIDISDGLALDLHRLCRESEVGAVLQAESLPSPSGFEGLCRKLGLSPLELALAGGEDYSLLFALPARAAPPSELGAVVIGNVLRRPHLLLSLEGTQRSLEGSGWDHFRT